MSAVVSRAPLKRLTVKAVIDRLDMAHNGRLTSWARADQIEPLVALWAEKLAGLDAEAIARRLRACEKLEHPPTPEQFRSLARRPPAHEPASPAQRAANQQQLRRAAAGKPKMRRRCITRPGYGAREHVREIEAVRKQGLPAYVADRRAMRWHGWTEADEAARRRQRQAGSQRLVLAGARAAGPGGPCHRPWLSTAGFRPAGAPASRSTMSNPLEPSRALYSLQARHLAQLDSPRGARLPAAALPAQ